MVDWRRRLTLVACFVLVACVPAGAGPTQSPGSVAGTPPQPAASSRTLRVLIRVEPASLVSRRLQGQLGTTTSTQLTFFNEGLAIPDERGTQVPDLATALPQLNSDSWTVQPDGTME